MLNQLKLVSLIFVFSLISGCANVEVWQKKNLAKPEMQWQPDEMQASFNNHVYFSKEASSGGNVTAGGGCGCN